YDVLQFLLDHGVDPDLPDHTRSPAPYLSPDAPLTLAVKHDDLAAARILLAHGAHLQLGGMNVLAKSSATDSLPMFGLLLDAGANPDIVSPAGIVQYAVLRYLPGTRDIPAKIDLLLRHGADPGHWVNALFNAIARRSGLASAADRFERDGGTLPESALYVPVKTEWVNELLASPVRAQDDGLEPLLREAIAIRAAAPCRRRTKVIPTEHICRLPRAAPTSAGLDAPVSAQPATAAASASPIPLSNRSAFVTYAAGQLQQQLPGFTVKMDRGNPSMLIVDPRGAKVGHLIVRQTYEWCRAQVGHCSNLLSQWLQEARTAVQNRRRTPDPNDLILLLGPREMFEKLAAPRASRAPALAMQPCVADLVCTLAVKEVSGFPRLVDDDDLLHMHLTMDQAMQLARKNLHAQLDLISVLKLPSDSEPLAFNDDTDLEGSRLALPSEWQDISARAGGDLIAAVPASNIVVYTQADRPRAVEELRKFARAVYPTAVQPVSTEIFRWNAGHWTVVP
ncbi:MAG: hypothetical protein KGO02_14695, partial [Alphaproteobacteria bacterium]|nr:hypothetical protein [Alphaproteobacteria bacterium]